MSLYLVAIVQPLERAVQGLNKRSDLTRQACRKQPTGTRAGPHSGNSRRKIGKRLEPLLACKDADHGGKDDDDRQCPADVEEEMIDDALEALIGVTPAEIPCKVTESYHHRRACQRQDSGKAPRQAKLQRMSVDHCLASLCTAAM